MAQIQAFIRFVVLIPSRILPFLKDFNWRTDITKGFKMFFDPSFDLQEALLTYCSFGIKGTLVAIVLSFIGGWGFFILALFNAAIFVCSIPVFWGGIFLLGFEVVGFEFLRLTRTKKKEAGVIHP